MVDVKEHSIFPTIVNEFRYNMSKQEKEYVLYLLSLSNNNQTADSLHTKTELKEFTKYIQKISEDIISYQGYEFNTVEITGMWANGLKKGDSHAPHTHCNNFLSGVFYVVANEETSPLQFFDPRQQSNVLKPKITEFNYTNSSMMQFNSVKNVGYIFPSWLQHWVPPTNIGRVSISWNVLIRGEYGDPGSLQNSYI